jgi:penicillin-binding protein 1A
VPSVLPVALGAADLTLYEQTAAYTVFPNDGVRIEPRYIRRVTDYEGHVLDESFPEVKDVTSQTTARTMVSMLQEVVKHGTAGAAARLNHPLAGKTGTTNDFTDAWFMGFSPSITCGVWIGLDEKKSMGARETGGQTALPIWMDFMRVAIAEPSRSQEAFLPPLTSPTSPNDKRRQQLAAAEHKGVVKTRPEVKLTKRFARPGAR